MRKICKFNNSYYLCTRKQGYRGHGAIAQLVEQRTENPCVPGSIPGGTTLKKESYSGVALPFLCPFMNETSFTNLFSDYYSLIITHFFVNRLLIAPEVLSLP